MQENQVLKCENDIQMVHFPATEMIPESISFP